MSKTNATPIKVEDEELVTELPIDTVPVHSVQDPADYSAAAMGRQDSFSCAKRSHWGKSLVVRIIQTPLPA